MGKGWMRVGRRWEGGENCRQFFIRGYKKSRKTILRKYKQVGKGVRKSWMKSVSSHNVKYRERKLYVDVYSWKIGG